MRVDVFETDSLPEVRPYFPGTPLSPAHAVTLPYPVQLAARKKLDFFGPRESFNVLAMFKNPMMMMMLGAGVLVLFMPTMMVRPDTPPSIPISFYATAVGDEMTPLTPGLCL